MPKWSKPPTYLKKAQCPMKQKGHGKRLRQPRKNRKMPMKKHKQPKKNL
jgi:hypothetical protein